MMTALGVNQHIHVDELNLKARMVWNDHTAKAREIAQQAHTLASDIGYERGQIDSLVLLAQCDLTTGQYEQSLEQASHALRFYEMHHIADLWRLNVSYILGTAYMRLGDYATALEWYERLIEDAKTYDDMAYVALGLRNIGSLYAHQGNYEMALSFLDQSIPYFEQLETLSGLGSVYNNYSWVHGLSGNPDLALEYGYRGVSLFEKVGHLDGLSRANIVVANLHLQLGNDARAIEHVETGRQIAESCGNSSSAANASMILSKIYVHRGEYEKAIASYKNTLRQAETLQSKMMQLDCHEGLAACYRACEDWKTALEHHEQALLLKDDIHTEESATKLRNLEVLYKTRQVQAEADAQRRLREEDRRYYEHLSRMKDDILNVASHDLKSPLIGVKMTVESLRRHKRLDDARGQQLRRDIETTIQQMGSLITNVLDLAKLETGHALNREAGDFALFLATAFSNMESIAWQKRIKLHLRSPLASTTLRFDAQRIHQVLQNLISNAIKYTPEGGDITLSYAVHDDQVVVDVADTGIGIPAHAIPFVFERFYRVPTEQHQSVEGTGLGLAIVKAIIEQHYGSIRVESEVNKGSTFRFTLPVDKTG
jgi:signal transduction histidine kinase